MTQETPRIARSSAVKVLITGAYGTGKTTLVDALADELRRTGVSVVTLDEVPRRSPYALNREQTPLTSAWLLSEQMRTEVDGMVGDHAVVLCDRGAPDIISHTRWLPLRDAAEQRLVQQLIDIARVWSGTYDLAFQATVDMNRGIEPDGLRIDDRDYQLFLEREIKAVYELFGMSVEELPRTLGARVEIAAAGIRGILSERCRP